MSTNSPNLDDVLNALWGTAEKFLGDQGKTNLNRNLKIATKVAKASNALKSADITPAVTKSMLGVIGSSAVSYGAARRLQPLVQKIVSGETLTKRESRRLFVHTSNLISAFAGSAYLGYANAKRLDEYNNR